MTAQLASPLEEIADLLEAAVRAYVPLANPEKPRVQKPSPEPSEWTLIFDTEATTDPSQRLRFGSFQWRRHDELVRRGIFHDPAALSERDKRMLASFTRKHGLELMTAEDFIETVFFKLAYELRATIVGFNLPFDISRLAIRHGSARRRPMRGGFSFQLSTKPWWPRIQVKHLDRKASMIRFTAPAKQRTPSGMRKRSRVPVRRGFFVDVKTIGAAVTSRPDTLASLAEFLNVPGRKMETDEHGGPLTPEYIAYGVNDTQVTWECYVELIQRYRKHNLVKTPAYRIYSEAGIGKAYLKEMGVQPFRLVQPNFPAEILNIIMQTYFGGRAEVHLRRVIAQILYCDFLSMYPTVCTLMGLWRWVIAKGIDWRDSTEETRALLESITLNDLQRADTWRDLATLVQVLPDDDILPFRAKYSEEAQYTIGLNRVSGDIPLWYTLADCINSEILTGRAPKILKALTFEPRAMQSNLRPINIAGDPDYRVDPRSGDFYQTIIERRAAIKARMKGCNASEQDAFESQQLALKILANSTSYGIFVEQNVDEPGEPAIGLRYRDDGTSFPISIEKVELPGTYFHPLLASLITGAARLMLGITERLATDAGIDWAMCDTDSMAFAKPADMSESEFRHTVDEIREWFAVLNPYRGAGDLLKLEDVNVELQNGKPTGLIAPLFAFAISAKRYVLFNVDPAGRPVLRKASGHGLGHLMAPYGDAQTPPTIPAPIVSLKAIGVERWQHDVWYRIAEAALGGNPDQVRFSDLPGFEQPAVSRYAATTPALLSWFDKYNDERDYADQVRPFNFLTAFQSRRTPIDDQAVIDAPGSKPLRRSKAEDLPRPIAPFSREPSRAAQACFDRQTGEPVRPNNLKTYAEALAQYHLHPESKFQNGEYLDRGPTVRRHVNVAGVRFIGKEANRWEEQFYLGYDPETQIEYDMGDDGAEQVRDRIRGAAKKFGQRRLAAAAGVAREQLRTILKGKAKPRRRTIARLLQAISSLATDIPVDTRSQPEPV